MPPTPPPAADPATPPRPMTAVPAGPSLPAALPADAALPATLAGRYELGELLGRGAHGEVRAAHDRRLDRAVAVKLLRREVVDDPELRRRFVVEGRAAAQLVHPNAVAVFDAGDDVVPFIVMERVSGSSIARELERGPFDVGHACAVASQVLGALGAAHALGIVHRDVKPANVLLTADGVAKVADFGVAKLATSIERTSTGVVVGTPAYLAPEVLAGSPASPASDVWAVGCLLHEMLTGRKPFEGDDPITIVHAVVSTTPERVDVLRPDVPRAVADIVARALRADVAGRWSSAADMALAIRTAGHEPPPGAPALPATTTASPSTLPATELGRPPGGAATWRAPGPVPAVAGEPTLPVAAGARSASGRRRAVVGSLLVAALAGATAGVVGLASDDDDPPAQTPTDVSSDGAATTAAPTTSPTTAPPTAATAATATADTEPTPAGGNGNGNGRGNGNGNGNDR